MLLPFFFFFLRRFFFLASPLLAPMSLGPLGRLWDDDDESWLARAWAAARACAMLLLVVKEDMFEKSSEIEWVGLGCVGYKGSEACCSEWV
jgi:cytochrome c biogenesis factor